MREERIAQRHDRVRRAAAACARTATTRQRAPSSSAQVGDLGYALLLKRIMDDPSRATRADITQRRRQHDPERAGAVLVVPHHGRLRLLFHRAVRAIRSGSHRGASSTRDRWYLRLALWSLPLPWLAAELGWIVAEYGRQPWAIEGVLPTALGVSSVSAAQVAHEPRRLRDLLHRARGRRCDPDGAATRARDRTGSACGPKRAVADAALAGRALRRTPCSTTKPCA